MVKKNFFESLHTRIEEIIRDFNDGFEDQEDILEKANPKGGFEEKAYWDSLINLTSPSR